MSERSLHIGQRVQVSGKDTLGTVAFVGTTHFSQGKWIGVVLDEKKGKNNGTVLGKSYFQCEEGCGVFIRQSQLFPLDTDEDGETGSSTTTPSASSSATTPATEKPKSSIQRLERRPSRFGGHQRYHPHGTSSLPKHDNTDVIVVLRML